MTATVPAPTTATYPLSLNQEFLRAFDSGDADGAFGSRHVLAGAWRVLGTVDDAVLRAALGDVVARHEVLRTSVARGSAEPVQTVHAADAPELVVRELAGGRPRDVLAEELLNELDSTPFPVAELPHLRAVLGRFDATDAVLVLVTHHTATDGWSLGLIARDVVAAYAARTGTGPAPEPVPGYGEFAAGQQEIAAQPAVGPALEYWGARLAGGRIAAIPTDRTKQAGEQAAYGVHRFSIDAATAAATVRFARAARSTPFMVLFGAYAQLLTSRTGTADVVVPTFTAGRYDPAYTATVGPFFNMCPLRIEVDAAGSFRDVVLRARDTCLGAFSHELPFALIAGLEPELGAAFGDPAGAVVAFEVLQAPAEETVAGGVRFEELRRRVISQPVSSGIPNGALWALDVLPSGEIVGSLKYDANHLDLATVEGLVEEFCAVLRAGVTAPDSPLSRR